MNNIEIKSKPVLKIRDIKAENAVLLAPMEGITDLAFRIICKKMGADIVYTEFIASEALIRDSHKSFFKMRVVEEERPTAIQIFGGKIESMVQSAKILEEAGADIIDINYGCWVRKVVNHNAGAALLKDPKLMAEITRAIVKSVSKPVTVKTRLGWDKNNLVILDAARMVEDAGASAIAVHCRTRDMAMKGEVDWSWVNRIKEVVSIPVILNGNVITPEDAKRAFDETGCNAVMVGRAAIGNPFVFTRMKEYLVNGNLLPEPSAEDKINICLEHLSMMLKHKDYERGIKEFRKHYAGYLKGLFKSSEIRQKLVLMTEYNQIEDALLQYKEFLKQSTINE